MTYEEALEIAMEELYDAVNDLRYNNKGYHAHIERQCNRLLTARNVLFKTLEDAEEKREWVWKNLTKQEFLDAVDGLEDLEDCWIAIQAKLKEKNV